MLELTVSDRGAGIESNELAKIFDSFYTTKPSGLGMGLSISRSIVEAHGGRIRASSTPGEGTKVSFTLPASEP
jgi:signal transduction histidine kinase